MLARNAEFSVFAACSRMPRKAQPQVSKTIITVVTTWPSFAPTLMPDSAENSLL